MSNKFLKGVELNNGEDQGYFIPNLVGEGAPSEDTEGAVGSQYMNTNNGDIYVCTAVENKVYTWVNISASTINSISPVMASAKGSFVRADDAANLPIHALALTNYEEGLNTVDVSVYGKNLANINISERTTHGITYKWENSTLTIWGKGTNENQYLINPSGTQGDIIITLPAGTYTASTDNKFNNNLRIQLGKRVNGSYTLIDNTFGDSQNHKKTFDLYNTELIVFRMLLPVGVDIDENNPDIVSLQIEAGPVQTEIETPITPQTATVDTVTQTGWENLRTNYGTTTIIPASGTVECTYVADTKLYIDNKFNALSATLTALTGV